MLDSSQGKLADRSAVLKDPIFQLNFTIWMLQTLPTNASIRPVLKEIGYVLHSISRQLPLPPALRPQMVKLLGKENAEGPCPDVIAEGTGLPWLLIECKASSFGPTSSTTEQALKLLAIAEGIVGQLGLAPKSVPTQVAYLTALTSSVALIQTLKELGARLSESGLPSAKTSVFGLSTRSDGVYVTWANPVQGCSSEASSELKSGLRVIELDAENDPRPLYFMPWDPSVTQSPEERDYCRAVLFARVQSEATSLIGRTTIPGHIVLDLRQILSSATYGVSDLWRSKPDLGRTIRDCRSFLWQSLESLKERLSITAPSDPDRIEMTVRSVVEQTMVIDQLASISPFAKVRTEPRAQASMFDIIGADSEADKG